MIRPAEAADIPAIHRLIQDLAEYEKALTEVTATEEDLRRVLLGDRPAVFAHVAAGADGEVAGFALWFLNFSTWTGQHGIYLEDLYVRPDQRRSGPGPCPAGRAGPDLRGPRLLPAGVVGAGLELPGPRVLRLARRGGDGRMDRAPAQRARPGGPGRPAS